VLLDKHFAANNVFATGNRAEGSRFTRQTDFGQEQVAPSMEAATLAAAVAAGNAAASAEEEETERQVSSS
jgi:hypothetical protein